VDGAKVKEKGQVIRNKDRGEENREDTTERRREGRAVVLQMIEQNMKRSRR
jgi:hypothetical protein